VKAACCLLLLPVFCTGCTEHSAVNSRARQASAPDLMIHYGCPACHVIPQVPGAVGKVGPPLNNLEQRSYLGGVLPNSPENLAAWVMHPQQFHPGTAMPEMGVTPPDAAEMTIFLEQSK
jgi:cytochrome c